MSIGKPMVEFPKYRLETFVSDCLSAISKWQFNGRGKITEEKYFSIVQRFMHVLKEEGLIAVEEEICLA